jgi:RNA-directed DNA polymerase
MATGLERIAAKARCEPKLRFTSLAHHLTPDRIWESLCHIPNDSAPGCDGQTVAEAKEDFKMWVEEMLRAVHHKGYPSPPIRRVYIPKPGKREKRPLGIPYVADRALQRESVPSPIRHLRAGFSTLFVWGATGHGCAPRIGNPE